MNEFIEKNRRLLRFYCVAARIIGWVLLTVPGIIALVEVLKGSLPGGNKLLILMVRAVVLNFMFLGLIALGVAQFIRYVFERQYQPGWILRNADKILYVYAVLIVLGAVWQCVSQTMITYSLFFSFLVTWLLPAIAKALILTGLGQILRRILPVIEESRTLV